MSLNQQESSTFWHGSEMGRIRILRLIPTRLLALALLLSGLAYGVWRFHAYSTARPVPSRSYQFQSGGLSGWTAIGGQWRIADGVVRNDSYERGAKLLTGSSAWGNYTMSADISFAGDNADMGVVVRASDEKEGTDTYNGYYIGVRTLDGTVVIGRAAFGWTEARPVHIPGGVHSGVWYRLQVTAYGCHIAASVQNLTTLQTAWIAFTQSACLQAGQIGLRSLNAGAMWRNVSVRDATWNDYEELRRNAGSVERLEAVPGPPWWTPWHVGMLFVGSLAIALLTQLIYFRIRQWKTYTITQERERLAHEIHDTMAQGFAGVGYQIQGIKKSILRSTHPDYNQITDQLSVAYQLIRNCHDEASRTIAMLGSSAPLVAEDLLKVLEETARKIGDNQIVTKAQSVGTPGKLNLRCADALLHIGREAIANAMTHGSPTELKIIFAYEGGGFELSIEDDGCGFEFRPESAGFGILGMQKRARDIGAILQINSSPGHGTQVRIKKTIGKTRLRRRLSSKITKIFRKAPPDV